MSELNLHPFNQELTKEFINMTKTKSDEKNNTEALTFPNSAIEDDEQAKAFHINSIRKSNREINRLASAEDYEADYWNGLLDS